MKIKTIVQHNPDQFDKDVNKAMGDGYLLERRELVVGNSETAHYAQLVLPDPVPEATNPLDLLSQVQTFCLSQAVEDCHANKCPLAAWCDQVREGGVDPSDWELPEVLA